MTIFMNDFFTKLTLKIIFLKLLSFFIIKLHEVFSESVKYKNFIKM